MAELKTRATEVSVDTFLDAVASPERRADGRTLCALMQRLTGEPPKMWGPSIIGFGSYHYRYDSGREGTMCRLGFSPRGKELALYLGGGFERHHALLAKLGKVRTGKSCLYIKRLADVEQAVLEQMLRADLAYMDEKYPRGDTMDRRDGQALASANVRFRPIADIRRSSLAYPPAQCAIRWRLYGRICRGASHI